MDIIRNNKVGFVAILLVVAGGVWYVFAGGLSSQPTSVITETSQVGGTQTAAEKDLLDSLLTLRSIRLDGGIFADPGFNSLRDFSTQIVAEPIGRDNPFAPLPSTATTTQSTSTSHGALHIRTQ